MSTTSHSTTSLQPALAFSSRPVPECLPTSAIDRCEDPTSTRGYAFETALCLVESQSPLLRPPCDAPGLRTAAVIDEPEAYVLSARVRLLTKLLAGVRGQFDSDDWRRLLDAAARVAGELTEALARVGERVISDPMRTAAERARATAVLAEARRLSDRLHGAQHSPSRSSGWVH